ncbi:MAG: hypothetical protein E7461_07835 [Ruminococcaceae bacterium]|nr:hypothetical protein [Oscillospiraceae bacterium]
MAYKIDYIPVGKCRYLQKHKVSRWMLPSVCTVSLLIVFFALTVRYGSTDWLLPGDPAVTKAALTELIENLKAGEQFSDAVTAFCREVIAGAA